MLASLPGALLLTTAAANAADFSGIPADVTGNYFEVSVSKYVNGVGSDDVPLYCKDFDLRKIWKDWDASQGQHWFDQTIQLSRTSSFKVTIFRCSGSRPGLSVPSSISIFSNFVDNTQGTNDLPQDDVTGTLFLNQPVDLLGWGSSLGNNWLAPDGTFYHSIAIVRPQPGCK